jgi:uncharacterized protein (TIGR03118 family)
MNRSPFALRYFAVNAAVAVLLAACGGGGDAEAPLASASNDDNADAATLAQVGTVMASVNASTQALGLSAASDDKAETATPQTTVRPGPGLFPGVTQTNLVANNSEFGAQIVEPDLKNPWGIAIRPAGFGGHFWFAAAGSGKSIQYVGDVGGAPLSQDALKVVDTLGAPSGVAFNPGSNFVITQSHANGPITNATKFFFANLTGTITAWTERALPQGGFDRPDDSVVVVDGTARHSSFVGVAVAPKADRLFAADFGADAALRVYDSAFVEQAPLKNPFQRSQKEPGGFEAFNVQTIGQSVFAMYGRQVPPDPNKPPPAEGRLAEFDGTGKLISTWRGRGYLNYPWGVAMAPKDYGLYSGCLLVGNFGDGTVVAFHPRYKVALDYLRDDRGRRVVIDGLWGLQFGNGASLGEANHMYFASGPNKEKDGLLGKLEANPRTLPLLGGISLCR